MAYKNNNSRNVEGDTYTFYDEPSEMPYVSPHPGDPRGGDIAGGDCDFATGGNIIHADGRVTTRRNAGPANANHTPTA